MPKSILPRNIQLENPPYHKHADLFPNITGHFLIPVFESRYYGISEKLPLLLVDLQYQFSRSDNL